MHLKIFATAHVVTAAVVGIALALVPGTAHAADTCKEGSRKIDTSDVQEIQTILLDGTQGHAEVTLRYSPKHQCVWGLLEGTGAIWMERELRTDEFERHTPQLLATPSITHTAALDLRRAHVRLCGFTFDGSTTVESNSKVDLNAAIVGKRGVILPSGGGGSKSSTTTSHGVVQCTKQFGF
jgi:hypothetical protein